MAAVPLPKTLARFNRVVTNPMLRHVAGRLPGFGIVTHVGRRSGRTYRSPVNLFRHDDRYGIDSQWVRNVLGAGSCDVETRGRSIRLVEPEIAHDPQRRLVPAPVRPILRLVRVSDFMLLRAA